MSAGASRMESMEAEFIGNADGSLFVQLADAYRESGDRERALRILRRGMERHPAFTPAYELLGTVLEELGRSADALVCFERLVELNPENATAQEAVNRLAAQIVARPNTSPEPAMPWEEAAPAPLAAESDVHSAEADVHAVEADVHAAEANALAASLKSELPQNADEVLAGAGHLDSTAVALSDMLVGLLEYRDPFFRGGTSLTRLLTTAIARELGLDDDRIRAIALGSVLRDLGQLPLRSAINKPGTQLGAEERRNLERHPETALEMLGSVQLPELTRDTIRHHHERWDGQGYPAKLAGEAIPLGARIVAVADSFGAMIAARPHRLPKRVPAALDDIRAGAGSQYDPAVVDALVRVIGNTNWKGPGFGLRHHVLIVDPDETRAMVIATRLCSNGYLAEAAFSTAAAQERLEKSRIVAIIISSDLPDAEEALLLREVRETTRMGMLPVIMTDTGASERVMLLDSGADVCLNRGTSFEELRATLEAFLRREGKAIPAAGAKSADAPWSGLQGDIQDFPLNWLLQVLNYDSRTAAVFIAGNGDEGAIYLDRGNPRHAQTRALSGEEAFRAMAKWKSGTFSVDPEAQTEEQTIRASLMNLLLESAVQEDHAGFFGQVQA